MKILRKTGSARGTSAPIAAGRARLHGRALGVDELIPHHRVFNVIENVLVRSSLVMMRVGIDDHEFFVAAVFRLLLGVGEKPSGVELLRIGIADDRRGAVRRTAVAGEPLRDHPPRQAPGVNRELPVLTRISLSFTSRVPPVSPQCFAK